MPHFTAIVTLLAVLFYTYTGWRVATARVAFAVKAPATTGHPEFERAFRVQMNTLEWMPIFLPLLWLCALTLSDIVAALVGLAWIGGRVLYMMRYTRAAEQRGPGFGIQAAACGVLLVGAVAGIIMNFVHGG
jgi:glutathione S-transferase